MRTANSIYDILNIIDEGILNNNRGGHYILFMRMIHNFVLDSGEIHSIINLIYLIYKL